MSRLEQLRKYGDEPKVPPVTYGSDLIRSLYQVGPIAQGGAAISWSELSAWSQQTCRKLNRWEAETLREMSQAYAVMAREATKPDCPAPWAPVKPSKEAITRQIIDVLKPRRRKPDKRRL